MGDGKEFSAKKLNLERAVIELRYPAAFKLPDKKFYILDKLTKIFPSYNIDQQDLILLTNPETQSTLSIGINTLGYDSKQDWSEFRKAALKISQDVTEGSRYKKLYSNWYPNILVEKI